MNIKIRSILDKLNTYVPGKPIEAVQAEYGLKKVIKLASNENPLGSSPKAIKAMKNMAATMSLYPDGDCAIVKAALSAHYKFSAENFVLGNGSDELLMMINLAFTNPGDEVIISEKTFSEYLFTSMLMQASIKTVPLKDYCFDLKAFAKKISDKTKIIFLCNPNNPTGAIYSKEDFEEFVSAVPSHVLLVVDEAYAEYADPQVYPDAIKIVKKHLNVIVLRTFSKVYGLAGLRIGFGIGSPEVIRALNKVREPFNVNRMSQLAAAAALQDNRYLEKVKKLNADMKQYIYAQFDKMGISYVRTQANFVCFETKVEAQKVFVEMLKKGVIIRPLNSFGMPYHLRVTTGTRAETATFFKCLKQVLQAQGAL